MWVRTPVIPGFNMEETELSKIRRFVAERLKPEQHEELPYHDYGAGNVSECWGHEGRDVWIITRSFHKKNAVFSNIFQDFMLYFCKDSIL